MKKQIKNPLSIKPHPFLIVFLTNYANYGSTKRNTNYLLYVYYKKREEVLNTSSLFLNYFASYS